MRKQVERLKYHPDLLSHAIDVVAFRKCILPLKQKLSAVCCLQMVHEIKQGAFPCSGRTDHGHYVSLMDFAAHILHRRHIFKALLQMLRTDEHFHALIFFSARQRDSLRISIAMKSPDHFHDLFFDVPLLRMESLFHCSQKRYQQNAKKKIDHRSEKQREKGFIGPGADDIRSLRQVYDRDIPCNRCHLYRGNQLSAVGRQEMNQRLREDHRTKRLQLSKAKGSCRFRLAGGHRIDPAAEYLRAVRGKLNGKCDRTDPERIQAAVAKNKVIEDKQEHHDGERSEDPDIQTGKRTDIRILPHTKITDQHAEQRSENTGNQREQNGHFQSGQQDFIPVFRDECAPDAVFHILKKDRCLWNHFHDRFPSDEKIIFIRHKGIRDIDGLQSFRRG